MARNNVQDPKQRELMEKAAARVLEQLKGDVWEVSGSPVVTVKIADGTYHKRPQVAGTEVALSDIYVGKRGKPIFVFDDVSKDCKLELDPANIDEVLETFASDLAEHFSIASERTEFIINRMVADLANEEALEAEKAAAELAKTYQNNPLFGRF